MLEEFDRLSSVVPQVPELLLDGCARRCSETRDEVMAHTRIATLMSLMTTVPYPKSCLPPVEDLFTALHIPIDDSGTTITPNQAQYIGMLAGFIHKNPMSVVKALKRQFRKETEGEFMFMVMSTIPAFYGFFSSLEHVTLAFPFYCTVVGTADRSLVNYTLLPFYHSVCTFRYIELVYESCGLQFCRDLRLQKDGVQKSVLLEYVSPLVAAMDRAYPLLPRPHQFLLKFMITRGWAKVKVLSFFVHKFTLPQLMKYVRAGPFAKQLTHLKALCKLLVDRVDDFAPLIKTFDNGSFFEVPSAFSVFGTPFTQLLVTTSDVRAMTNSLEEVDEIPARLRTLMEASRVKMASFVPFWIRVYARVGESVDISYNWRNVVFSLDMTEPEHDSDFERTWRQLKTRYSDHGKYIIDFLKGRTTSIDDHRELTYLKTILTDRFDKFLEYAVGQGIHELQVRSQTFERYLVHSMALDALVEWKEIVDAHYAMTVIPVVLANIHDDRPKTARSSIDRTAEHIQLYQVRRLRFMKHIEGIASRVFLRHRTATGNSLQRRWGAHVENMRQRIVLPPAFSNSKENSRRALQLNQKLWTAIAHLGMINRVEFEWGPTVVFGALAELDDIVRMDDNHTSVVQFAIAFSDSSTLLWWFLAINMFVVRTNSLPSLVRDSRDERMWFHFDTAMMALLEADGNLLADAMAMQQDFVPSRPVCK